MYRTKDRPIYLKLHRIHLPVTAVTSLAHRLSGLLLSFSIPGVLYLLHQSLQGPVAYEQVLVWLENPMLKLWLVVFGWSLAHHLLAGVRFLFLDMDYGVDLRRARTSAWLVNMLGVAVAVAWLGVLI